VRFHQAYDQFVQERRFISNVTPSTLRNYRFAAKAFTAHMDTSRPLADLDKATLKALVVSLAGAGLSPVSINTYTKTLNTFLRWAQEEGLAPERLRVQPLMTSSKLPEILTPEQINALLACKPSTFAARRTHTLCLMILDTGLRLSEALDLRRADVDMEGAIVNVASGKGRRQRHVPISGRMIGYLLRWLRRHRHDQVFPTQLGGEMTARQTLSNFKAIQRAVGISGVRFSPHTLRHSMASYYVKAGGDVFRLQRILGHADLTMTRRYVSLNTKDLSDVHDQLSVLSVFAKPKRR